MSNIKKLFVTLFLCITFLFPLSLAVAEDILFTSYNMWYEPGKEKSLWCINYKKGIMIPAGTEVRDIRLARSTITFITAHDSKQYHVKFNRKYHPGKSVQDYSNLMFTERDFTGLTSGLTDEEVAAIRKGVIVLGMSKRAVVTSYGYPAEHRTPSVDANEWTYWMDRFRTKKFHFDENGETVYPVKPSNQL